MTKDVGEIWEQNVGAENRSLRKPNELEANSQKMFWRKTKDKVAGKQVSVFWNVILLRERNF